MARDREPVDHARAVRLALVLFAAEAALALAGHPLTGLTVLVLTIVPGLALAPLLPAPARRDGLVLACAAAVLGVAAASVAFITLAVVGLPLDGVTARVAVGLLVVAGLALPWRGERPAAPAAAEVLLLALALGAGILLEARVLHGFPVPGNDWAKYLLYADEIHRRGSLLIDNPYWMLGVPFREDPGVPSVYGAFLAMTGAPPATLAHGIWVFAVLGIGSMFAFVRSLWGPVAGGLAALLYAVLPMNQDILGWHGLANVAALAILPLVLLYAIELARGKVGRREAVGFATVLIALAAAHRLSATVTALALLPVLALALAAGPRREVLRGMLRTAVALAAVGWGVARHLIDRNRTFGGTQGYQAYLHSKLDLHLVVLDLTWPFSVAAAGAAAWALWRLRRDPPLGVLLAFLAVVAALSYVWLLHIPLSYLRMAYYLPVALVPLLAVVLSRLGGVRRPWLSPAAGVALAAVVAVLAWPRAEDVRSFYTFADRASLRGLDGVAKRLHPGEVVVTDRCWSFLSTWLLHTRTLPALYPEDIQPKAELRTARLAQAVLDGTPRGVRAARRLGVRFLIVNPGCVDPQGQAIGPPLVGTPLFVSRRLVVLELPSDPRFARGD